MAKVFTDKVVGRLVGKLSGVLQLGIPLPTHHLTQTSMTD